jgi:serine/threonine-protein kinase
VDDAGDSTFPNWPELRRLFAYDNLVGKVVQGRYEVVRRLGAGGMGVVFLARHVHLDKLFALKIISPRFIDEPEIARRFLLEARAASKIDHPNVVSITDFGPPEEGPAFFAMEYLEGEDLARLLAREGPLPRPRALTIAAQIARALVAAHARGVIHRDIKPQNCLRITRDDQPDFIKVLDFGLAKVLSGTGKNTWTVGGSPGYIAPEIYRGGRTDHRVDIFALGVVLHTLLIGRLPAQSPGDVELPPGAPVLHLADLPPELRALIQRATSDDPDQRHPTAEALLAAIEAARAAPDVPPVLADMSRKPSRRWPPLAAAAALAAAVTVALAVRGPAPADTPAAVPRDDAGPAAPEPAAASPLEPPAPADTSPVPPDTSPVSPDIRHPGSVPDAAPVPRDTSSVSSDSRDPSPPDRSPVPSDRGTPVRPDASPAAPDGSPAKSAPDPRPTRRPGPFDEAAARALLGRHAAELAACKASSSFRGVATTVRLAGTVEVDARGRGAAVLPPGYDVNACLERVVAGLRFRASESGGSFAYTFLL